MELNKIYQGNSLDILKTFPDKVFNCCTTSPPYFGLYLEELFLIHLWERERQDWLPRNWAEIMLGLS